MGKKDADKPRGRMSSYAFFVQVCREEHKKKHPGENVNFREFSKKCSEKWASMTAKEKKRFEEMAEKDKARYEREMAKYVPPPGESGGKGKKRKQKKDPNAPKRGMSAFFFFCAQERPALRAQFPDLGVGEIAKKLGDKWSKVTDKSAFEKMAANDKARYEKEKSAYSKKAKASPQKKAKEESEEEEEDDEEEEDEDDDDDDE
ncbi:high mobility group protein B2-like [Lingula anatina]|uniref:High mobility group protein B2 n=1 Tax=Lingula anatina TaxID=7574 RepID=A0A1S3ID25_LINAN|nr:high mobility group protein B2 [Lingula anatina]XP_013413543.1 high mobility group protein B2-like [Lingula anatina]|eukprot:XP_013396137.1 high mobility group protein B2 [Lingula anatina]